MNPVDKAIEVLNRFLKTDPVACKAFIEHETHCNHALADDPDIIVGKATGPGIQGEAKVHRIRALGVINGILGAIPDGPYKDWGPIAVVMEQDGTYTKFGRTEVVSKAINRGADK
jgi:hypothetical protein